MSAASEDVKHAEGPSHELHFDPDLEADGPKRVRARPMSTMSVSSVFLFISFFVAAFFIFPANGRFLNRSN